MLHRLSALNRPTPPASLARRAAAEAIDSLLLVATAAGVKRLLGLRWRHDVEPEQEFDLALVTKGGRVLGKTLVASAMTAPFAAYQLAGLVHWRGQTLGRRLVGIRVVARNGGGLTYRRAIARVAGRPAAGMAITRLSRRRQRWAGLGLSSVNAAVLLLHSDRRSLDDLIAGTRVIDVPRGRL